MPHYLQLGSVPAKRHIHHHRPEGESFAGEGMYYEHILTTDGFDREYAILYHLRPPTRVSKVELAGRTELEAAAELPLRHVHLRTSHLARNGDPIRGRIPLLFNDDLTCYRCRPERQQDELYRNGAADEVIFVQSGQGSVETTFGTLPYRRGDYLVIPRTTVFRFVSDNIQADDFLILETNSPVRLPKRYFNAAGQLLLGAPYYERDFHGPSRLQPVDRAEETPILTKDGSRWTRVTMSHHPLDVVGWDGYLYPFTFNAWDFEPLTGTVHLPPPYQQTFECRGYVICTFAPRYLDHHPDAVKVPYAHSNVQADEVLFYVDGNFSSRRGVEVGSLTLHPGGIPHGPHPGTIRASRSVDRTEEMAVMFDTERPLHLTRQALDFDDPNYPFSWL